VARFDPRLLLILLLALPALVFALAREAAPSPDSAARQVSAQSSANLGAQPDRDGASTDTAQGASRNSGAQADQGSYLSTPASCPAKSLLVNYEVERFGHTWQVPIWQYGDGEAFSFASGMTIDADGAPNAYNAENTGLDDLANAGSPGHWEGILQNEDGSPLVQGPGDPYPGYYISCTALADWTKAPHDPARFVNAAKIPYIVLPGDLARQTGARPGDMAVVVNIWNGEYSYAIFGDVGTLGEGSIALANNLGISSDARHGGTWWGVMYLVFPGSGDHRPKPIDAIDRQGQQLLSDWGGVAKLNACAKDAPRPPRSPFGRNFRSDTP